MISLTLLVVLVLSLSIFTNGNDLDEYSVQLQEVFSSSSAYLVFYYMGNDDQSSNFGPLLTNMKEKIEQYGIELGAIDCSVFKKECKSVTLTTIPSIQLYIDDPVINPYTKKDYRNGIFFDARSGPNDLKELERFINRNYPNNVVSNVDSLDNYVNPTIPPAIFFTEKKASSSMLLKSIAHEFRKSITVIQFDASKNSDEIKTKYNISKFPKLMVIDSNNQHQYYDGDLKARKDIVDWLKQFAKITNKSSETTKDNSNDSKKTTSNNDDDQQKTFTSTSFESLSLLSIEDAWIVAITKTGATKEIENWTKNVQACEGHIRAAEVTCLDTTKSDTLGEKLCNGKLPYIVQIPYGANNRKKLDEADPSKWKRYIYESNEVDDARKEAGESLPESAVIEVNEQIFEGVVNNGHNNNQITVVIISEKSNATPMLRNLALSLKSIAQVGLMANPSPAFLAQIGNPKLPTAIFGTYVVSEANDKSKGPEMKIQLMAWDHKVYGPLKFASISGMTYSYYRQSGLTDTKSNPVEVQTVGDRQKDLIAIETEDDWNSACGENYRGICAIGFVPSESQGDNARQILSQVLESLSVVSALKFVVIDAGCQREFAETFFIQSTDIPTITAYSPSKSRYVNFRGSFSLSSAREFLESVIHGRISTIPISSRPKVASACDTSNEPIIEDNNDDADDFLAEIKKEEEERKKRLKLELEEDAKRKKLEEEEAKKNKATTDKKKKKKKKKKTKSEL